MDVERLERMSNRSIEEVCQVVVTSEAECGMRLIIVKYLFMGSPEEVYDTVTLAAGVAGAVLSTVFSLVLWIYLKKRREQKLKDEAVPLPVHESGTSTGSKGRTHEYVESARL